MIKRSKRINKYTIIDNNIINNRQLSYEALGLLVYILSKPDNWTVKNSDLANRVSGSRDTYGKDKLGRIIKELITLGYAVYQTQNNPETGRLSGKVLVVFDCPQKPAKKEELPPETGDSSKLTERRVSRPSVSPTIGKPTPIVNTDIEVSTEVVVSTESDSEKTSNRATDFDERKQINRVVDAISENPSSIFWQQTIEFVNRHRIDLTEELENYAASIVYDDNLFPIDLRKANKLRQRFLRSLKSRQLKPVA